LGTSPKNDSWIAYDLDGTLAYYEDWETNEWKIGIPIPYMLQQLQEDLEKGYEVRILTARAGLTAARNDKGQSATRYYKDKQVKMVKEWCLKHLGVELVVTASKDFKMLYYYDDRCKQVVPNEGILIEDLWKKALDDREK
jgi:hypothetical protein